MKKLFFMLFSIALLASCSDDDDVNNKDDERIYGKWFVAEAKGIPGLELDDCNRDSYITFNSDNTTYSEYYTQTGDDCTPEDETESVWEVNGDTYTFTIPFENLGQVNGDVSFNAEANQFTFTPRAVPSAALVFEMR